MLRTDSDSQGVATQVQALAMFGHSRVLVYFHCHRRVLWPENRAFLEDGIQMLSQHKIRSESISDILSGRKYTFFVICISTLFVYLFCLFFVFTFCYSV